MGILGERADPWASLRPPPGGGGAYGPPPDVGSHGAHQQRPQLASCRCRPRQRLRRRLNGDGRRAPRQPTVMTRTHPGDPVQSLFPPQCSASNGTQKLPSCYDSQHRLQHYINWWLSASLITSPLYIHRRVPTCGVGIFGISKRWEAEVMLPRAEYGNYASLKLLHLFPEELNIKCSADSPRQFAFHITKFQRVFQSCCSLCILTCAHGLRSNAHWLLSLL
jgi:hypothetical protein